MSDVDALVTSVRAALAEIADPARAPGMRAYMKSTMPYRGVPVPVVRATVRRLLRENPLTSRSDWEGAVRRLFDEARFREERYAALAVAGARGYSSFQTPESLPLYEHLVVTGAWWDIVDDVAHRVGDVLLVDRRATTSIVRSWSRRDDLWLRRCSIICQLGHKSATDRRLLTAVIDANLDDREFFIRKAIGWALREYARTDPDWVRAFAATRGSQMSALSRQQALKHLV